MTKSPVMERVDPCLKLNGENVQIETEVGAPLLLQHLRLKHVVGRVGNHVLDALRNRLTDAGEQFPGCAGIEGKDVVHSSVNRDRKRCRRLVTLTRRRQPGCWDA